MWERYVSIPFIAGQWSLRLRDSAAAEGRVQVSIPFIAGQWSLPKGHSVIGPREGPCFNPLHCGAVVASHARQRVAPGAAWFQSPSLRGSGRFGTRHKQQTSASPRFNPLHCGAVVASGAGPAPRASARGFQSPSLRGSGRFSTSIPKGTILASFNPLHCGAVVASGDSTTRSKPSPGSFQSPSLRGSGRFWTLRHVLLWQNSVSIPFIAGQWSLLTGLIAVISPIAEFQSPSLRGSGRFPPPGGGGDRRRGGVSIPFIAGQWSLPTARRSRARPPRVSIPFIAGQWSLPIERGASK